MHSRKKEIDLANRILEQRRVIKDLGLLKWVMKSLQRKR